SDEEVRVPERVRTVEQHNQFNQAIVYAISYEPHYPARYEPKKLPKGNMIRLKSVFTYPLQAIPEHHELDSSGIADSRTIDANVLKNMTVVRVSPPASAGEVSASGGDGQGHSGGVAGTSGADVVPAQGSDQGPFDTHTDDGMAAHILTAMQQQGQQVYKAKW